MAVLTEDAGQTWSPTVIPGSLSTTTAASCVSDQDCAVTGTVGARPAIATTHDGGATWSVVNVGRRSVLLASVSCGSTTSCVAVGATQTSRAVLLVTADGGSSWTNRSPVGLGPLRDVACLATGRCQAVGIDGITTSSDAGVSWTSRSTVASSERFLSVACTPDGECHAVGWSTDGALAAGHPLAVRLPADGTDPVVETTPLPIGFLATATCTPDAGCLVTSEYGPGTMVLTNA